MEKKNKTKKTHTQKTHCFIKASIRMQLWCAEICGKYCVCGKDYDAAVKDE